MMTENIQTKEVRCVEGLRMMLRGMALVFGTMAEGMGSEPAATAAAAKAVEAEAKPAAVSAAKSKPTEQKAAGEYADKSDAQTAADEPGAQDATDKSAEAAVSATPDGKQITRSLVERAMCAKIKELAVKGHGPDAVGTLFPLFHGATCVSDLTVDDYPAFLAELAKL